MVHRRLSDETFGVGEGNTGGSLLLAHIIFNDLYPVGSIYAYTRIAVMVDSSGDVDDKLAYFQVVTGIEDAGFCLENLEAHGWYLETAVSAITTSTGGAAPSAVVAFADDGGTSDQGRNSVRSIEESPSTHPIRLSI
ncbi:Plant UBX domain-containing protein 10 [Nymphaea thermarum]|nr:Plant UBX domain-containing protein 10 [Nymphaea thermarum]